MNFELVTATDSRQNPEAKLGSAWTGRRVIGEVLRVRHETKTTLRHDGADLLLAADEAATAHPIGMCADISRAGEGK